MVQREEHERQAGARPGARTTATKWGETFFIWIFVALGGVGLWVSAADPIFGGGADGVLVALTIFGFFVALGIAVTAAIWLWPAAWKQWSHRVPPDGGGRLDAAKMLVGLVSLVLALLFVIYSVSPQWHPVAIGLAAGGIALVRLAVEIWLHHRLGK
jgi:hypothetical protein